MQKEELTEELYADEALAAEFSPGEDDYDDEEFLIEEDDYDDEIVEDDYDDESLETESTGEDDYDDEAEFLSMLMPPLIGGAVSTAAKTIGRVLSPTRRYGGRRFRPYNPIRVSGGVRGGTVMTPRGAARVRLPTSVVSTKAFQAANRAVNGRINSLNHRLNKTQQDVKNVDKKASQAATLAASNSQAIARLNKTTKTQLRRWSRIQSRRLAKLKKDQDSQATMNLLMNMMQYNNIQSQLEDHTHDATGAASVEASNNMMMLLPLMMSDSGDDDGMMMAMMFMMMNNNK